MNRLSSDLIMPTIPNEPPPTLAEQRERIAPLCSRYLSLVFERPVLDEEEFLGPINTYLYTIFLPGRAFLINAQALPPVAGMRVVIPAFVISKILPTTINSSDSRIVGIVAFKGDDTNYPEVAHQLIHFMDSTKERYRDQPIEAYLLVGHECLVFKTGPGSQRIHVSRTHGPIINATSTGFLTTELCRLAREHWNWD